MNNILEQLDSKVNDILFTLCEEKLNVKNSSTDFNRVSYMDAYDIKGDEVVFNVSMFYSRDYDVDGWRDSETFRVPLFTAIAYIIYNLKN